MDAQERYARIQQKEEELKRREANLREQQLGIDEDRKPNWPPCCPFVYHNITEEIPVRLMAACKIAYLSQALWALALIFNCLAAFGVKGMPSAYSISKYIVFSIIFAVLGIPLAFRVNYMKFYDQCKKEDLTLGWFLLQVIFFALNAVAAVAPPASGLCGILFVIDAYSSGSGYVKIVGTISACLWVLSTLAQGFIGSKAFVLYKGKSGNTAPTTA